ncbi:hypothetical protein [Persephonella sp.]
MVDPKKLRKLKIEVLKEKKAVLPEELEKLAEKISDSSDRNFIIGLKHIAEKHYTEAIKWLQLSECRDSPLIIALLAFKLADEFLFEEYFNEKSSEDCLKELGFEISIEIKDKKFSLSAESLKILMKELN